MTRAPSPRPVPPAGRPAPWPARALALFALLALPAPGPARAEAPARRAPEMSVSVTRARSACFREQLEVTGVLSPRDAVDVAPERDGLQVAQVLAAPLDEVSAGQVLARLAPMGEGGGAPIALRAPVSGTVLRGAVTGQPAAARLGPLFRIAAGGRIDLEARVPAAGLARLAAGQRATVRPLGLDPIAGQVRVVDPTVEPATQLGRVRISLEPGTELRVGTFARGVVTVAERCGLAVPYSAVLYEAEGTLLHVVNGDRVEARPVEVGLLSGEEAEIRAGLSEDDLVIVRAGPFVCEGDPVTPIRREAGGR